MAVAKANRPARQARRRHQFANRLEYDLELSVVLAFERSEVGRSRRRPDPGVTADADLTPA
jgi:hypothetical protein